MRKKTFLLALAGSLAMAAPATADDHGVVEMEHGSMSDDAMMHSEMPAEMDHAADVGEHAEADGHAEAGDHAEVMALGRPGDSADVTRTIDVTMKETDDGAMVFEPAEITVEAGETVRFAIQNNGALEHEFVMNEPAENQEHKTSMERFPEMEHAEPNAIRLAPDASGEIIWTFANAGDFEFACLIPGHYEAGMHGMLKVTDEHLSFSQIEEKQ